MNELKNEDLLDNFCTTEDQKNFSRKDFKDLPKMKNNEDSKYIFEDKQNVEIVKKKRTRKHLVSVDLDTKYNYPNFNKKEM